jgi:hypothetical protein
MPHPHLRIGRSRLCSLNAVDQPRVLGGNPTGGSSCLVWCFQLPKRHVKRSTASPPTHCAPGPGIYATKQVRGLIACLLFVYLLMCRSILSVHLCCFLCSAFGCDSILWCSEVVPLASSLPKAFPLLLLKFFIVRSFGGRLIACLLFVYLLMYRSIACAAAHVCIAISNPCALPLSSSLS